MILKRGKRTVLTAQDDRYKRGLLVQYNKDGSYDMEYWFDKPSDVYPVEVTVDGRSVKKDARKVSMLYHPELGNPFLGESIIDCAAKKSYWECYKERFLDFYEWPNTYNHEDLANVTWELSAAINAATAWYILDKKISVGNSFEALQNITKTASYKNWFSSFNAAGKFGGGIGITVGQWGSVESSGNFAFYMAMGFGNVKEFYAYMALMLAWAYGITKDEGYRSIGLSFIDKYWEPPVGIEEKYYSTPSSNDKAGMNRYANEVLAIIEPIYQYEIRPYLLSNNVSRVLSMASYEMSNARDTMFMAAQHKHYYDSEKTNWTNVAIGVLTAYVVIDRVFFR